MRKSLRDGRMQRKLRQGNHQLSGARPRPIPLHPLLYADRCAIVEIRLSREPRWQQSLPPHLSLQQPVPTRPYIPHPATLSRQRLQGMADGDWAMCPDLLVIPSSGKPIRCFSCHGTIADVHAAHASRSVVRLEAERGSTRSRTWFDSKQNVVRLEADRGSSRNMMARRQSLCAITVPRRQENCRVAT